MGQRNRTVDLEMEQQQSQASLQPEPCIFLGSFPQQLDNNSNVSAMVANVHNLEAHSLQDPTYDHSAMFYGLPQYHHHQQRAPTNFYLPYVAFQAPPGQLPSSSSHGVVGVSSDHEYERNAHFMDHSRGTYKRKNAEVIPGNPQYLSTLAAPFNAPETVAPFAGARNRPGAVTVNPVLPPHAPNNFIQGSYPSHHPFPPPGSIWYDQHHSRSDGSPSFWPHTPYMHGGNIVAGSIESSSRNPTGFMYPSQLNPRDHYYSQHHHPVPPPVQGVRGQNTTLYPHMASSASYRVPPGSFVPQNAMNSGPPGSEMGSSHVGPVQPTGFRIYQHHQRDESVPVATLRQHRGGVPRLRVMPDDEVALLEFGDFLGGSGNNHIDHHRDMRLDIEEMSYEDLLALSERIGTVNTGLPEEEVKNHLKTRTCYGINLEKESSSPRTKDIEAEPCTICQESFKNEEKIATLDCGHEYHAECLEKWLIVKNVCPICKAEALVMEKRKI
ncbi:putative E3 ubiquitin-protein ligase HIP1 [Cardamine amara subsp. amara]|uniref:RING-type E3 ubiquitin transferase n=1 Tax=Cardamine amara subsp. amara TaxID=228776 RepID=A0ABD0Z170_CARAN